MNLFVPYEIALKAKEAGFDEECLGIYTWDFGVRPSSATFKLDGNKVTGNEWIPTYSSFSFAFDSIFRRESVSNSQIAHIKLSDGNPQNIAAPLYQQLIDWFREKHKLMIYVSFTGTTHKGVITWKPKKNEYTGMLPRKETIDKKDYYKVLNSVVEQAFELI